MGAHLKRDPTSARLYGRDLTTRERQVMQGLLSGGRVLDVAKDLGLAGTTVSTHRKRARDKLGGRTMHDAMIIFLKREIGVSRFPWEK